MNDTITLSNGDLARAINPTEMAYAAEEACGPPYHLRAVIVSARHDGRETKPGEIARMWAEIFRRRR